MKIIGENIHIMSPKVKEAIANRDPRSFRTRPGARSQPARGRSI